MAQGFRHTPHGYAARFEKAEFDLIRDLAEDVIALLESPDSENHDPLEALIGIVENPSVPDDPAVARVLPAGSSDPEAALEYRRYTEQDLRATKVANLSLLAFDIEAGDIVLGDEHAHAWASALNDIRLVLGSRLDIIDEERADQVHHLTDWSKVENDDDYLAVVYNFVTWVQDSLMVAMLDSMETPQS